MIPLIKLAALLAAVIVASGFRVPVAITLIFGAISAGFLFLPLNDVPVVFWKILTQWDTWKYVVALWAVLLLEGTMNKSGMLKSMAGSAVKLFTDKRFACLILPSIIGFMPSVGGAYFSAPLVQEVAKDMPLSGARKSFINYWFRHIWENSVPLYPGVIMAAAITGFKIPQVMLFQFPVTLVGAFSGFAVGFWNVPAIRTPGGHLPSRIGGFLNDAWPVILAIVLVISLPVDACWAIISAVLVLWVVKRPRWTLVSRVFKDSVRLNYFILLLGSVLFNQVLQNSTALGELAGWFKATGLNPVFMAVLLPMMIGMLVGVTPAFVGITFPIVLLLAGANSYGIFALAFNAGVIGVLFSPIHVCLILTCEYFKTKLFGVYKFMAIPALIQLAVGLGTWWVLGLFN